MAEADVPVHRGRAGGLPDQCLPVGQALPGRLCVVDAQQHQAAVRDRRRAVQDAVLQQARVVGLCGRRPRDRWRRRRVFRAQPLEFVAELGDDRRQLQRQCGELRVGWLRSGPGQGRARPRADRSGPTWTPAFRSGAVRARSRPGRGPGRPSPSPSRAFVVRPAMAARSRPPPPALPSRRAARAETVRSRRGSVHRPPWPTPRCRRCRRPSRDRAPSGSRRRRWPAASRGSPGSGTAGRPARRRCRAGSRACRVPSRRRS